MIQNLPRDDAERVQRAVAEQKAEPHRTIGDRRQIATVFPTDRGVGFVAVVRAGDSSVGGMDGMGMDMGMGMSMSGRSMMEHMAPAPMDGVPDATASRATRGAVAVVRTVRRSSTS